MISHYSSKRCKQQLITTMSDAEEEPIIAGEGEDEDEGGSGEEEEEEENQATSDNDDDDDGT
jgi:hypothetical protein